MSRLIFILIVTAILGFAGFKIYSAAKASLESHNQQVQKLLDAAGE